MVDGGRLDRAIDGELELLRCGFSDVTELDDENGALAGLRGAALVCSRVLQWPH